jgi:hypothetical protein
MSTDRLRQEVRQYASVVVFQLNHAYSGPLAVQPDSMQAVIQQIGAQ